MRCQEIIRVIWLPEIGIAGMHEPAMVGVCSLETCSARYPLQCHVF